MMKSKYHLLTKFIVYAAIIVGMIGLSARTMGKDVVRSDATQNANQYASINSVEMLIQNPKELIAQIETAEKNLLNLMVESELWIEERSSLSDPWVQTPQYCSSTAWFGEHGGLRRRIDVHKEVLGWKRATTASYTEDSYSIGFDGREGREVFHTTGSHGKAFGLKRGRRISVVPQKLRNPWVATYTGTYFSFHFHFENNTRVRSFSNLFRMALSSTSEAVKSLKVAVEKYNGTPCIKIESGEQSGSHSTWWLDPSRGFVLLGYEEARELADGSVEVTRSFQVAKLKQIASDIWYAVEVLGESVPLAIDLPYTRYIYHASNVVANNPKFDENVFTIPFPEGYSIDDQVDSTEESLTVKSTTPLAQEKPTSIEEQVELLRIEITNIQQDLRMIRSAINEVYKHIQSPDTQQAKAEKAKKYDTNIYDVKIGSSPIMGPKDAPVTIVEFSDFQCPYCVREFPKLQKILDEYPDQVRLVFKHYPLSFHKKAPAVHAATELALRQRGVDAFWMMHQMIMDAPKELDIAQLREYAVGLELNMDTFDKTMASEATINELLKADKAEAGKCNVSGTPTILINGLKLTDRSIEGYKARIDGILAETAK